MKVSLIVLALIASVGCAQFQKPVSVLDSQPVVHRDIQSFTVRNFGPNGRIETVKKVVLDEVGIVTEGPCQFEDGTTAAHCVMWSASDGPRQMELKPGWGLSVVTATVIEDIN